MNPFTGVHSCPECMGEVFDMGRSFKVPKKSDHEQWAKVQKLYLAGFRFFSYRSYPDAEPLPGRLRDVEDFILRNPHPPPFKVAS